MGMLRVRRHMGSELCSCRTEQTAQPSRSVLFSKTKQQTSIPVLLIIQIKINFEISRGSAKQDYHLLSSSADNYRQLSQG